VNPPASPSHQVLEDAADWFALLRSGHASEADTRRWRCWLEAHPDHRYGWQLVQRIEQQFNAASGSDPAHAEATLARTREQRMNRRGMLKGMALMLGVGGLGWASWRSAALSDTLSDRVATWGAEYRTGTGEIRELALEDGSRLWMNTHTAIDTQLSDTQRRIRLIAGEILLETGADPRPLIVTTAHGQLRPLGTRFTVRDQNETTLVAVYQGSVAITNLADQRQVVPSRHQTRFSPTHIDPVVNANPAREAWRRGILLADDIRLADLADELTRYQHGFINVSPEVAGLRVFGGYPLTNPTQTLSMLEKVLPIRVSRPLPWWTNIRPANSDSVKSEK